MTAPRFYCPIALPADSRIDLPNAPAHHAVRVLRLSVGDAVILFNGQGGETHGVIERLDRTRVTVALQTRHPIERESSMPVTLIQALASTDKMDLVIQKAVELGVARIVPVVTERSVVRLNAGRADKRLEHWRGVVIAACEQCGRNRLPEVTALAGLRQGLEQAARAAARWELSPATLRPLRDFPKPPGEIALLVGAEGGLSPAERAAVSAAGFVPVQLGPRVLRTETAGLAALAAIHALWGDF
ncbi:MAG: 16S rRNA (uracil(1498)-N(3))-methyltransferase [Candidatus Muproteobacteria bacterium RBG_16_64_11]|uniref:Ribosomal RNA small subunit methyltransferase E n=1 Tax=Candidatus Muproteobacteria bacterium RBG_16_64_11 TaxID=1817758 RepID=A0A1F6TB92_9PROT|nr:MAG: 16S rRNA (uracil(1498)-N(3))-methyltransferase [Candidatus Muproteobacteria bacterium RBG_16_64_11]